jgi:hypothetical protein
MPCVCRNWGIPLKNLKRWVVSLTSRPPYPRRNSPRYRLNTRLDGHQSLSALFEIRKILALARVWTPDRPGRSLVTRILFLETFTNLTSKENKSGNPSEALRSADISLSSSEKIFTSIKILRVALDIYTEMHVVCVHCSVHKQEPNSTISWPSLFWFLRSSSRSSHSLYQPLIFFIRV